MTFAFVENGVITEYPIGDYEVRERHPGISFPTPLEEHDLTEFGIVSVKPVPHPTVNSRNERLYEDTPVLIDGVWQQNWTTTPLTPEEKDRATATKAVLIRQDRDRRLSDSDWTQLPDAAGAAMDVPAWTEYRKQLRSVPEQPGFPWDVQWPAEPPALEGPILDYGTFFSMLVGSSVYAAIRAKAATDPSVLIPCIELLNALGDARNGRPNPALIQAGLSALVTAAQFNEGELAAFQALLDGLGFSAVYSLS